MERLEAYIWDLDGTLLDSYGSIVASLAEVAKECGAADSDEKILKAVKQGSVSGYLRDLSAECFRLAGTKELERIVLSLWRRELRT